MVYDTFNSFEGFKCNEVQGAMYAFPQITIPPKAIAEAKKRNLIPDEFYAFEVLDKTGICIIPGSGFGQKEGTFHFRTTILPPTDALKDMLLKFQKFHKEFVAQYKWKCYDSIYDRYSFIACIYERILTQLFCDCVGLKHLILMFITFRMKSECNLYKMYSNHVIIYDKKSWLKKNVFF